MAQRAHDVHDVASASLQARLHAIMFADHGGVRFHTSASMLMSWVHELVMLLSLDTESCPFCTALPLGMCA